MSRNGDEATDCEVNTGHTHGHPTTSLWDPDEPCERVEEDPDG